MEGKDEEKQVNDDTFVDANEETGQQKPDSEAEQDKDRKALLKRLHEKAYGKDQPFQTKSEFIAQQNIDPEDPDTVPDEVLSEDENPDNLISLDPDLLDPAAVDGKEVVTLGAEFPDLEPSQKDLDKDPVLDPDEVTATKGIIGLAALEGYLQYHRALSFHKRKIYLHASVLKKEIKAEEYRDLSYKDLELLLERAENSKFYLDQIHVKLANLYKVLPGQKTSQTCANRNLSESIVFLKKAMKKALENEIGFQRAQAIKAQEDLDATQAQLDAIRANPRTERPPAGTVPKPEPQTNPKATSTPTGKSANEPGSVPPGDQGFTFGAGTARPGTHNFGYENFEWKRGGTNIGGPRGRGTRPRGGRGGNGGGNGPGHNDRYPDLSNPPPFRIPRRQPDEEELDPKDLRFARIIAGAIRHSVKPEQAPNYRGIEKPKINFFDGDASKYSHWKSTFHLMYTSDRNLPESHLATALFGLLKGEAKRAVEIHITAEWDGTNYQEMWKQLDLRYGTKHVQARCIRDKANKIVYLESLSLKTALAFYEGVTVQVNHHLVQQPHAVQDDNSHLFQFLKEKMSDKLIDKYIEYCDSDIHQTPLQRTVLTLQYWLERQISRLQEVEITSNTSKQRSSKSPHRQVTTGYVESDDIDYVENEDVSEYDSDEDPSHTILRTKLTGDKVHYNYKKNKYYKPRPYPKVNTQTQLVNPRAPAPTPIVDPRTQPAGGTVYAKLAWPSKECYLCRTVTHELADCEKFKKLSVFQRYSAVSKSGSCYHCLKRGHGIGKCNNSPRLLCGVDGCTKYEHPLIHADATTSHISYANWSEPAYGTFPDLDVLTTTDPHSVIHMTNFQTHMTNLKVAAPGAISIQTVVCTVTSRSDKSGKRIVAMLDTGSNTTCIDEDLARTLRCKRRSDTISKSVSMLDGVKILQSYTCEVILTSGDGLTTQIIIAHTIKNMTEGTSVVDWSKAKKKFAHLRDVPFDAVKRDAKIELLIGSDNAFLFAITDGTLREGARGEPIAYRTPLGWTCIGPTEPTGTNGSQIHNLLLSKLPKPKSK